MIGFFTPDVGYLWSSRIKYNKRLTKEYTRKPIPYEVSSMYFLRFPISFLYLNLFSFKYVLTIHILIYAPKITFEKCTHRLVHSPLPFIPSSLFPQLEIRDSRQWKKMPKRFVRNGDFISFVCCCRNGIRFWNGSYLRRHLIIRHLSFQNTFE